MTNSGENVTILYITHMYRDLDFMDLDLYIYLAAMLNLALLYFGS